jgi:hypothetical protein
MSRVPPPDCPPDRPIAALIPAALPRPRPAPAPVGDLPPAPTVAPGTTVFVIARLNPSGQISARTAMSALGWTPGDRIAITVRHGTIVVCLSGRGGRTIGADCLIVLPVAARRMSAIADRSSVLLAALPDVDLLFVHPIATVARLLARRHAQIIRSRDGRHS